jgi:copper chaperone CopZ
MLQTKQTVSFKVFGVCASLCKPRIEAAAIGKGVKSAVWNVDTKMLTVVYEPAKTSLEKIENRIVEAGHDLENKKANDAVYNALPSCCHYREMESMQDEIHPASGSSSQPFITGVVLEEDKTGSFKPLAGASVIWLGTNKGTTTDDNGVFSIAHEGERLIVSYTGFPGRYDLCDARERAENNSCKRQSTERS